MPPFAYTALGPDGRERSGTIESPAEREAIAQLTQQALYPLEIHPAAASSTSVGRAPLSARLVRGVTRRDITDLTRQLATLLQSGFPLARALQFIGSRAAKDSLREIVTSVSESVRGGVALSDALADHPRQFDKLYVNMVAAGEASGQLAEMLARLAQMRESAAELRAEVRGAMTYPAIMLLAMGGSVAVLMMFVLPKFAAMFEDLGAALPAPTLALMHLSHTARTLWWVLGLVGIAAVGALAQMGSSDAGRLTIDRAKLRAPLLGGLVSKAAMARFSRTLQTLLDGGLDLVTALECVRDVTGNEAVAVAVAQSIADIKQGKPMGATLGATGAFPDQLVEMVSVGEESGQVPMILAQAAHAYEQEVRRAVKTFTSMIEPIMILVMGAVIGFVVMAMLLPIFEMNIMAE